MIEYIHILNHADKDIQYDYRYIADVGKDIEHDLRYTNSCWIL